MTDLIHATAVARWSPTGWSGALLAGLDRRVAEATQMPVHIADDPLTCVVRGTGRVLEDLDTLERVLVSEQFTRAPR